MEIWKIKKNVKFESLVFFLKNQGAVDLSFGAMAAIEQMERKHFPRGKRNLFGYYNDTVACFERNDLEYNKLAVGSGIKSSKIFNFHDNSNTKGKLDRSFYLLCPIINPTLKIFAL